MNRTLLEAAQYVVGAIHSCGCDVSNHSRFANMLRILREGVVPTDHPQFESAIEAVRDIRHLEFIFDQLVNTVPPKILAGMVRDVRKDSVLPQNDLVDSLGRNIQTELYTASICSKAGLQPVFAEPDIRFILDGVVYGIAVKRTKRESRIEEHIRKAAQQIERSNNPGFIVMDVTMVFNLNNERLIGVSDGDFRRAHEHTLHEFTKRHFERFKQWIREREVRGLILFDHSVRQHPTDGWGLDSFTYFIPLSPDNQRRYREFMAFQERFKTGFATTPE